MTAKPQDDGRQRPLEAEDAGERERLRHRLEEVEADPGGIDARHGRQAQARERIGQVRRSLHESERHLDEASSEASRREVWAAVSEEVHALEARRRR